MANSNDNAWDAAHTVIGFISVQGLYGMSAEKFSEICEKSGVSFSDVQSKVKTHYRINGDIFKSDYIENLG